MRIIAGSLKGRRLKAPTWDGLRPTSDKLRETLFNILAPRIAGARVLDGYAGTGALGIEALSRGAAHVTFVERRSARAGADRGEPRALRRRGRLCYHPRKPSLAALETLRAAASRRSTSSCSIRRTTTVAEPTLAGRAAGVMAPDGVVVLEHARRRLVAGTRAAAGAHARGASGDSGAAFYEVATSRRCGDSASLR